MKFQSTRNKNLRFDSAETIIRGLSDDGGLFVPVEIPVLEKGEITELSKLGYCERAKHIFAKFMTDFSEDELLKCAREKDVVLNMTSIHSQLLERKRFIDLVFVILNKKKKVRVASYLFSISFL